MTFDEWWPTVNQTIGKMAARCAWEYQQQRIVELEDKLHERTVTSGAELHELRAKVVELAAGIRVHVGVVREVGGQDTVDDWIWDSMQELEKLLLGTGGECKHEGYNFAEHGRCCWQCGKVITDFGD